MHQNYHITLIYLGHQTAVANVMAKLLEALGCDDHRRIVFICHPRPLMICGVLSSAEMDVSIIEDNEVLMLVRKTKELAEVVLRYTPRLPNLR
jgi:hypothetical protein